ncbi:MAG: DAK2 domain-containing protein [Clostridiales bacterium]|jgi:DAK2 domain fusion protein YloV|nr:DAK2 domain-containing protein [Clostridiales bacterium]
MGTVSIDGNLLKKMIVAGSNALNRRRAEIDAMNVFPVPDGDTGVNMAMTVLAAAREAAKLNTPNIYDVAKAASGGALRGARGNSGVIMSQLFRGFAKGLEGVDIAVAADLANASRRAMETAYKAVMKPKEGTILTIARALSEKAAASAGASEDMEGFIARCLKHANDVLEHTPQMLPELMQAGVVDAGGKGLLVVLESALKAMSGSAEELLEIGAHTPESRSLSAAASAPGDIKFGYCTEFFIMTKNVTEEIESDFKRYLESVGDSIVAVADDDLIKIHVHTNHPGRVLEKAMQIGGLTNMKIENMRLQHTSLINFSSRSEAPDPGAAPHKAIGFAAVSSGAGFNELFISLGADEIIHGGQTMNPSTDDILNAISRISAETVYVLPNNKNIILAAEQAARICAEKRVIVLPAMSIPQGLSCMISYSDMFSVEENTKAMREAMKNTHSGQVTVAVRETTVKGVEIHKGDYLYLLDNEIELTDTNLQRGAERLIDRMAENGAEVIAVYYGQETDAKQAHELADFVKAKRPDIEIEVLNGGQPVYFYVISAE